MISATSTTFVPLVDDRRFRTSLLSFVGAHLRAMDFGASLQKEKVTTSESYLPMIFVSSFHIHPQLVESSFLWRIPDFHNNEAN
ncbi:hypothetical protein G4B88_030266 [Cannabis sativa]|uniref:Uncharacterized protein n=1 Tax=Cannabis sativa TaxID=3483 RepID=A0A7J6GH05_CANSA|nr:hypothetical protein G4B88_030266 [Cannabis sativa]